MKRNSQVIDWIWEKKQISCASYQWFSVCANLERTSHKRVLEAHYELKIKYDVPLVHISEILLNCFNNL